MALEILEDLARENEGEFVDIETPLSNLRSKSTRTPPFSQFNKIETFVDIVTRDLEKIHQLKSRGEGSFN